MDASPESTVISGSSGPDQSFKDEKTPPSSEGLVVQIVATKPNKENSLLTYIRILNGASVSSDPG
jgi:hypothetical protein